MRTDELPHWAELKKLSLMMTGAPATGKSTVVRVAVERYPYVRVPGETTRIKRLDEVAGVDYNFISKSEFMSRWNAGRYVDPNLEVTEYNSNNYGSPISWIDLLGGPRPIIFTPTSVVTAQTIRDRSRYPDLIWIHLWTPQNIRESRLNNRSGLQHETNYRLVSGDSQAIETGADLTINTSSCSPWDVLKLITGKIL